MSEPEIKNVLRETWFLAETITENEVYQKLKYRKVQRIGFYIRPARTWFYPCEADQKRLKKLLAEADWILGNKSYEPLVELNTESDVVDDDSWQTLEEHKATKEELKRIGVKGWKELGKTSV